MEVAAAKSGINEKTARKYRDLGKLPSELKAERIRTWRTREDPFEEVWEMVKSFLENNSGFEAKDRYYAWQRKYGNCGLRGDHPQGEAASNVIHADFEESVAAEKNISH